ncbi:hypothetical protein SCLCIDRAFT_1214055 [Scleroderma citrinum Foug A]|uniref:Uncharacterized protein n=1 Tax=Scleroderma citrinum Foug A TaxID=1036808 RepID=A0A0C2ZQ47_9AGAM|nr:hypothetical protein SCLCIDRAFT_1214055 [Scleroderma citrinum Foug A]
MCSPPRCSDEAVSDMIEVLAEFRDTTIQDLPTTRSTDVSRFNKICTSVPTPYRLKIVSKC